MPISKFKLWSEKNSKAKRKISPAIGMRGWDALTGEERKTMSLILKNKGWFNSEHFSDIYLAVYFLNERFKKESYGKEVLKQWRSPQ